MYSIFHWNVMYIISAIFLLFCPFSVSYNLSLNYDGAMGDITDADCQDHLDVNQMCDKNYKCLYHIIMQNGYVTVTNTDNVITFQFNCVTGYKLLGRRKIACHDWNLAFVKPICVEGCLPPPMILNGEVLVNGQKEENTLFSEGVVAEYACAEAYTLIPIISQHRVCRRGEWTGPPATCVFQGCPRPNGVLHGIMVYEREGSLEKVIPQHLTREMTMEDPDYIKQGIMVHYRCDDGFNLVGPDYRKCQSTGLWHPLKLPICKWNILGDNRTIPSSIEYYPSIKTSTQVYFKIGGPSLGIVGVGPPCISPSFGPHVRVLAVQTNTGNSVVETANTVPHGTVIEATCAFGYRDKHLPCIPQILRCDKGNWQGHLPSCDKADNCIFPTKIPHGELESVTGGVGGGVFGVGGQVTYSCLPGYQLAGEPLLTCQASGCWDPNIIPLCIPQFYWSANWPVYFNTNTSLLLSVVTALSVLFILLSVCVAVVCRHRPAPLHHHHSAAPTSPPTVVPPPDPDRVALIAFADSIQSGLPTYEEAVRGANGGGRGLLSYRLHHPPWLQRRNPRSDATIVTRQLSSTGDSMGSTDTMTVSDVSTNVTLDTVSSHTCSSTSQTASCRAICGSLASFDTNSVLNTEGVPLLEENELEENGANMDLDDNSMLPACDNTSFKLQSDIDSIHS